MPKPVYKEWRVERDVLTDGLEVLLNDLNAEGYSIRDIKPENGFWVVFAYLWEDDEEVD